FDELGKQNDPNLKIGLVVYADAKDCSGGSGPYPGKGTTSSKCIPDVAPAAVNAAQLALLKGRITGTSPNGSTPTYEALEGGYKVLRAVAGTGKKVLVLMSDGVPSSNQGQSGCITLVGSELKKNPSIQTFSVGIGPFPAPSGLFASYDPEFMSRLALAGGTKANPTCSTNATNVANVCHFQVTPGSNAAASTKLKQDFVDAINKVRGLAIGCEYKLENNGGGAINPNKVNVVWTDGSGKETFVPKNAQNGWSYDDDQNPTKVILHGTSCSDATEDLQSSVKVVIGCDTKT
ncbi:MAG: VWA domain-containing protein, partial [Polyangiaceae bacterium]|nr:VWA domain-containing protein [Polyangiaceae bacterium]